MRVISCNLASSCTHVRFFLGGLNQVYNVWSYMQIVFVLKKERKSYFATKHFQSQSDPLHILSGVIVVNFLSQVIFIFHLFQPHQHRLPYPKTKEKQKLPEIKKLTTAVGVKYTKFGGFAKPCIKKAKELCCNNNVQCTHSGIITCTSILNLLSKLRYMTPCLYHFMNKIWCFCLRDFYRVPKCDVIENEICEIMRFVKIL